MLVFTTFIVKDVWREESKDFGESVEKALNEYRHDIDRQELTERLKEKEEPNPPSSTADEAARVKKMCDEIYAAPLREIIPILNLVTKIPSIRTKSAAFELDREIDGWFDSCSSHAKELHEGKAGVGIGPDIVLRVVLSSLKAKIGFMKIQIEIDARWLIDDSARKYNTWRKISYALYGIAWGFTLIGKLSKLPGLAIDE
jgi:hypothetical protein